MPYGLRETCPICGERDYFYPDDRGTHRRVAFGKDAQGVCWEGLQCYSGDKARSAWHNPMTGELRQEWRKGGPAGKYEKEQADS